MRRGGEEATSGIACLPISTPPNAASDPCGSVSPLNSGYDQMHPTRGCLKPSRSLSISTHCRFGNKATDHIHSLSIRADSRTLDGSYEKPSELRC